MSPGNTFAQGLIGAGNAFSQIFDPRYKLQIDQLRAEQEAREMQNKALARQDQMATEADKRYRDYEERTKPLDLELDFSGMTKSNAMPPLGSPITPVYGPSQEAESEQEHQAPQGMVPYRYGASSPVNPQPDTPRQVFKSSGLEAYREVDPRVKALSDIYTVESQAESESLQNSAMMQQDKQAIMQLAKKYRDMGPQYEALAVGLEGVADIANVDRIKDVFGTNIGGVGLEGVEQSGRIDLENLRAQRDKELEKMRQDFDIVKSNDQKTEKSKDDANKLRSEIMKLTGDYQAMESSYQRIQASAEDPSAAGDLALIFNYMKMLDPNSVVRESEFQQAAQAGNYGDRIQSAVNRALSGQRLSEDIRRDFLDRADRLYVKQKELNDIYLRRYTDLANQYGVDPNFVTTPFQPRDSEMNAEPELDNLRNKYGY